MAREFDSGSSQYLEASGSPITATPLTVAFWFYLASDASAWSRHNLGGPQHLTAYGAGAAWRIEIYVSNGSTTGIVAAGSYNVTSNAEAEHDMGGNIRGAWHHAAGVFAASNDRTAYCDGSGTNDTTSVTDPSPNTVTMGCRLANNGSRDRYVDGLIAEAGIWSVALAQAEIDMLVDGFSPPMVRPDALVCYWPLIRDTDQDWVGGYDLTAYNTPTVATHVPTIIYPAPPPIIYPPTAVAAIRRVFITHT